MQQAATTAPQSSPALDPELQEKATRLKTSRLFVNPSDAVALMDKQLIFLVLAGEKPVAEVSSGHWVDLAGGRTTVADDPDEVGALLTSLGLKFSLTNTDGNALDAIVSLRAEQVDEMVNARDVATAGRLFGYPKTAVLALEQGEDALIPLAEQHRIEAAAGLPPAGAGFSYSRGPLA